MKCFVKKVNLDKWDKKTKNVIILLKNYDDRHSIKKYNIILKSEIKKLKKFLIKIDKFMHCTNLKKKEKLKLKRNLKSNEEITILKNIWELSLICDRFEHWNINFITKKIVKKTIYSFFSKNDKVCKYLEDNFITF